MWNELSFPWQKAFELAWTSFKQNTIPIGTVIVDEQGNIVCEGRNRIYDSASQHPLTGTTMAHAEMTAMSQLKIAEHPNIRSYTLYSTMEPCPMCFGACVMVNIRHICFAAHDGFAGATSLNDKLDYIKSKKINVSFAGERVQAFQLILQSAFEAQRNHPRYLEILNAWSKIDEIAVTLGRQLSNEQVFNHSRSIKELYNDIMQRYDSTRNERNGNKL
jgi:tRNA(adenine34) deaminase